HRAILGTAQGGGPSCLLLRGVGVLSDEVARGGNGAGLQESTSSCVHLHSPFQAIISSGPRQKFPCTWDGGTLASPATGINFHLQIYSAPSSRAAFANFANPSAA